MSQSRILLVEDDVVLQTVYRMVIERADRTVWTATSVGQALILNNRYRPNILILDIMLDDTGKYGFTGVDVARVIQSEDPAPHIIFISTQIDILKTIHKEGIPHYAMFSKPVNPPTLAECIRHIEDSKEWIPHELEEATIK